MPCSSGASTPRRAAQAAARPSAVAKEIEADLDAVSSLDEDRIIRGFLPLVAQSLRTNYYQRAEVGGEALSLGQAREPRLSICLPLPRPLCEIYSAGARAWRARICAAARSRAAASAGPTGKEDFRTEILGLMKAQMVKNAVIVPTGSKGGFVVEAAARASATRSRPRWWSATRNLMRGMLDLTDNIVGGRGAA